MKRKLYAALLTAVILFGGCTAAPQPSTSATPPTQPQNQGWTVPENAFPSYSDEILYVRELGKVTGKDAFTDTAQRFDVGATDLGFCYYDAQMQRLVTIFGDTYGANKSGNWRSNVALYTDQTDYFKGIAYNGALTATGHGESGAAVQLTPNGGRVVLIQGSVAETPKTSTCIPTGAVMVGDTTYLFYMEVDENGFQDSGEWFVYCCRVLKSEDHGASWTQVEGLTWQARTETGEVGVAPNFAQIYPFLAEDGYIYIYGIPGGRSGGTKLSRVEAEKIEEFESYEYFTGYDNDGAAKWRTGSSGLSYIKQRDSAYVIDMPCGERGFVSYRMAKPYIEFADRQIYRVAKQHIARRSELWIINRSKNELLN